MEIFKALKEDSAPETHLQILIRKGAKREIPYIAKVHLSSEARRQFKIDLDDGQISLDMPWTTVPKQTVLQNVRTYKDKSPFYPYVDHIKVLREADVIIGLDTSNLKNLTNYLVCVTQEGRTAVLEELKALHVRIMDHINKSFAKEPGTWFPLGSEQELQSLKSVGNRPLISYEWIGNKIDRMDREKPLGFTNVDAGSSAHTYCSITNSEETNYKLVKAVLTHAGSQAAPEMIESAAQTISEIPINATTQFNPEIDAQEKEERIQNEAPLDESHLAEQIKQQYKNILPALQFNSEFDLFKDDYEYLVKSGQNLDISYTKDYTHYLTLVNTNCDQDKYITCTAWHPGICGTVAVAYGEKVSFREEEILSDSDNSDYQPKPSKPEEYQPKIKPYILAKEVSEASNWKAYSHEMCEHFARAEDDTRYKLGIYTMCFLNQVQKLKEKEIELERDYVKRMSDLESLEFELEYIHEVYDEATYNPAEDLLYKFRLDEYASVPADDGYLTDWGPDETKQRIPAAPNTVDKEDQNSFSIVWDTNHWKLSYGLREEANAVHRRNYANALQEVGPLHEPPRTLIYCPFLRVKRAEYRAAKSQKNKKKHRRQSRQMTRNSIRTTSNRKSSVTSRVSMAVSIGSRFSVSGKSLQKAELKKAENEKKYLEISDDDELERHEKEQIIETGHTHNVFIWSLHNDLEPMLVCVSPYEVSAMNFCPHNGNILVAGTISGQVVLWDLTGLLMNTSESDPSAYERHALKQLKKKMTWYREWKMPGKLKETAVSSISGGHNAKVISIHWVHPQLTFDKGQFLHLAEEDALAKKYSEQFFSTSLDGDIKCWDLGAAPLPKPEYIFAERTISRKIKHAKPEPLTSSISKYEEYHMRWMPVYTMREPITESAKGVKSQSSLVASSVQFESSACKYIRKYPPDPHVKDKQTDLVEYVFNPLPQTALSSSNTIFMGTMFGAVALLSWGQCPKPAPKQNEVDDTDVMTISLMEAVHDGPIQAVLRHPIVSDIALSVGGHVYAIWNVREMTWPIKWKRYFEKKITCCSWSPLKPSLFRIGLTDGTVEIWDLIFQSHEPVKVIPASGVGITGFSSHTLPLPRGLNGCVDQNASIVFYYIPWVYQSWRTKELTALREMLEKEPGRKKALMAWANGWKSTHVRLTNKLEVAGVENKFGGTEKDEDENEQVVVKDEEDEIFKIGQFELKKQVPAEQCKAYYRELYKWYLRRRGRTTKLLEAKEAKWYEKEEKTIIQNLLRNKRIDLNELHKSMLPLVQNETRLKAKESRVIAMLSQADAIFKTAVSKIFNAVNHQTSYSSKDSLIEDKDTYKFGDSVKEIEQYFGPDHKEPESKLCVKLDDMDFPERLFEDILAENIKKREIFNDRRRFWDPEEKWMRIMARTIIEENGYICGQWEPHELSSEYRKYNQRLKNVDDYKQLFSSDYDPLWDLDKTFTDLSEFPYDWPYRREEEFGGGDASVKYRSELKQPLANLESGLDLEMIANAGSNVMALMEIELEVGEIEAEEHKVTIPEQNADDLVGAATTSSKIMSTSSVTSTNRRSTISDSHSSRSIESADNAEDVGSKVMDSASSFSLANVKDSTTATAPPQSTDQSDRENVDERWYSEMGERSEMEEIPRNLAFQEPTSEKIESSENIPGAAPTSSADILLPEAMYPENWKQLCEDECLSEGESIPSAQSSPSFVTDESELSDVELYVPSNVEEDQPLDQFMDESKLISRPLTTKKHLQADEEEPTEEYMGDSDNEETKRRFSQASKSLQAFKKAASSSSDSFDDPSGDEHHADRSFTDMLADRMASMAEREKMLRDLE